MGWQSRSDKHSADDKIGGEYGFYLVAFCDLLGQQTELKKLEPLVHGADTHSEALQVLRHTAGRVLRVRRAFKNYFDAARKTDLAGLEKLTSQERSDYLQMRSVKFHQAVFSDSIVISVPLFQTQFGLASAAYGMWTVLYGLAGMMLVAMSAGVPVRAGVDVERGVSLRDDEVYGLGLAKAYELESKIADYPRAVMGPGFVEFLDVLRRQTGTKWDVVAQKAGQRAAELVCRDLDDGRPMLHVLSSLVLHEGPQVGFDMHEVSRNAYDWTKRELDRFRTTPNQEALAKRYERLLRYFNAYGFSG